MLDADTFATAVVARVQELDHPRDVIALAIEAVALRGVLVSVMDLTDLAEATLIGGDPEVVVPIAEVLAAVRDRISVGMATVADIVGRVASC